MCCGLAYVAQRSLYVPLCSVKSIDLHILYICWQAGVNLPVMMSLIDRCRSYLTFAAVIGVAWDRHLSEFTLIQEQFEEAARTWVSKAFSEQLGTHMWRVGSKLSEDIRSFSHFFAWLAIRNFCSLDFLNHF